MKLLRKIEKWWDENRPVWCRRCGYVMGYKHAKMVQHNVEGRILLCQKCYVEVYHPFTKDKD